MWNISLKITSKTLHFRGVFYFPLATVEASAQSKYGKIQCFH
mgnify:CR=1 FL=1